jgi:hypothetical protein
MVDNKGLQIRCTSFIQAVMKKPEWKRKLADHDIIAKWKKESAGMELREPVFEYAIKELTWLSNAGDAETGIEPTGVDFVWVRQPYFVVEYHQTQTAFFDSSTRTRSYLTNCTRSSNKPLKLTPAPSSKRIITRVLTIKWSTSSIHPSSASYTANRRIRREMCSSSTRSSPNQDILPQDTTSDKSGLHDINGYLPNSSSRSPKAK